MRTLKLSPSVKDQELAEKILSQLSEELGEESKTLVEQIMELIVKGKSLTVVIEDEEYISTQKAAELLNVSRPYVVKLLEEKKIPYLKVGRYRRILVKDVVNYQQEMQQKRLEVLDELTQQAQELKMGY